MVFRRQIRLDEPLGIISLVLFENVVDGSQQHSGDGDNSFPVTATFLDRVIAILDFVVFVTP